MATWENRIGEPLKIEHKHLTDYEWKWNGQTNCYDMLPLILLCVFWLLLLRKSYWLQFLAVACNHGDMVLRSARDVALVRGNSDGGPILCNHGDGGAKSL